MWPSFLVELCSIRLHLPSKLLFMSIFCAHWHPRLLVAHLQASTQASCCSILRCSSLLISIASPLYLWNSLAAASSNPVAIGCAYPLMGSISANCFPSLLPWSMVLRFCSIFFLPLLSFSCAFSSSRALFAFESSPLD